MKDYLLKRQQEALDRLDELEKEILEKHPDPGVLKNPTPVVRWPFILYDNDEEGMSFQPFERVGCLYAIGRISGLLLATTILVTILFAAAWALSVFGIVEPLW